MKNFFYILLFTISACSPDTDYELLEKSTSTEPQDYMNLEAEPHLNLDTVNMMVNSSTVDCYGEREGTCLLVQEGDLIGSEDWEYFYFYNNIEGFNYEPGFVYGLVVKKTEVENPMAGTSSIKYELEKIVFKEAQEITVPENATEISTVNELIAGLKSDSFLYLKAGDYVLPSIVYLKDIYNLHVIGSDNVVIKGDFWKLIEFTGDAKNISFKNIKFHSTSNNDSDYSAGLLYFDRANAENILIEKCQFTAPNISTNGLKFINEVNARSSGIVINNCSFFDIGRMGIETQNHTYDGVIRLQNLKVTNCDFKNLGLQSPYGMAISLSGSDQGAELNGNTIADSKDIGIEVVGWENVLISNNTFSANKTEYQPFSIQKTIGSKNYITNIKVINNTGSSNIEQGEFDLGFANMDGFVYSGNSIQADFLGLFDVKNSTISDNVHTTNGKQVIALFNGSQNNTFTGNTFKNTNSGGDGVVLYPGMTGNTFKNTTVILTGTGGTPFNDMNNPGDNVNTNMTVQ